MPGQAVTLYYDPVIDEHHRVPVMLGGTYPALYLATQVPDDARALFDVARAQAGMSDPEEITAPPGPRLTGIISLLAKEWGLTDLAGRLRELADERYEPTWDRERGEFTWGFGLGEEHPRGQYNAMMAAAEAMSAGAWSRLATNGARSRCDEPTVEGVDFPTVVITRAWWDGSAGVLTIGTAAAGSPPDRPTSFRVRNLPGTAWRVDVDGSVSEPPVVDGEIEVHTTAGTHAITVMK